MVSDYCRGCAFYNEDADLGCEFGRDNPTICSVLMKKMKTEKRELKYENQNTNNTN